MSRAQCYLDSDLLRQLRTAAPRECSGHYNNADGSKTPMPPFTTETLLDHIVRTWLAEKPYAALQQRLDAARKAEEERFWEELARTPGSSEPEQSEKA